MNDLARLQERRLRDHRLDPSAPIANAKEATEFLAESGVVMASGKSSLPSFTEAVVGHRITGSWMADPEVHRIYDVWQEIDNARVISAPLVQGKEVFLRAEFGDALASVAGDPDRVTRAVAGLKPLERQLYDAVCESGEVRMDEWAQINLLKTSQVRTARTRLSALFLVAGDELHTDAGYHTVVLRPAQHGKSQLTFAAATGLLLLAAIRACVLADVKEVRKWNDWSADALDALVDAGDVVAVDRYVVCAELFV